MNLFTKFKKAISKSYNTEPSINRNMKVSELEELKFKDLSYDDILLVSDMDEKKSKKISIRTLKKLY